MPRARPGSPINYGALPTEASNPKAELLDTLPPDEVVKLMVDEEANAVRAVRARAAEIARAARLVADKLIEGGRIVYAGAGTSGRLGTLDGAECVPTFGIPPSLVVPIIA